MQAKLRHLSIVLCGSLVVAGLASAAPAARETKPGAPAAKTKPAATKAAEAPVAKPTTKQTADPVTEAPAPADPVVIDPDDPALAEQADAEHAAVAKPVTPDPVRVYGWREHISIDGVSGRFTAKLDTGALTSSIHAEEQELFERDGAKWVRFIVTDPGEAKPVRTRVEAPLVRIARIKEPGAESVARQVVRLSFQIGERRMRGEFTLNDRRNMLAPVLIGRSILKDLGWVDPGRTHLAGQKILR